MRILAVRARAFGPLRGRELVLQPGMNVIHGPNEAGKSSWHAAIFAGLCGMRRVRGGRKKEEQAFIDRHRPWNGDDWSVEVDIELADGRRIQIMQDLDDPARSRAIDLQTGDDVTGELVRDGAPDAASLLGLTRETLPETICVRQAEVLRVLENAKELQVQIQQAAATGSRDHTAESAIERIREFKRSEVGLRRSSSTKPLQSALDRVEIVCRETEEARAAHEEYLSLMEAKDLAATEANRHGDELRAAERTLALRGVEEMRERVEGARALSERFPDGPPPEPAEDRELLRSLDSALDAFERRPPEPAPLQGRSAERIEADLRGLPSPPAGETEPAAEVLEAFDRWHSATREVEFVTGDEPVPPPVPQTGGLDAQELRSLTEQLETAVPEIDVDLERRVETVAGGSGPSASGSWRPLFLSGGAVLTLAGVAVTAFLADSRFALGLSMVIAGAALLFAGAWRGVRSAGTTERLQALQAQLALQRAAARQALDLRSRAESSLGEAGLPSDTAELRRLAAALSRREAVQQDHRRWEERLGRVRIAAQRMAATLGELLESKLDPDLGEDTPLVPMGIDDRMRRYRSECAERADLSEAAARREHLERALSDRRRIEADADAIRRRRLEAERGVLNVASVARIFVQDPDAAVARLRELQDRIRRDLDRRQDDRDAWSILVGKLDGRALEELEAELNRLERGVPDADDDREEPYELGTEPDVLVRELEKSYREARGRLDRLLGQIEVSERDLPDVAAAEEAEQQARRELERVETLERSLECTLGFLETARDRVQRDIAPRLGASVQERLSSVTAGRYDEVLVNPGDLEVQVRARGGDWHSATALSHGTTEQIYLLVRLALAEHLVTTGEPAPLVLDDVTVQSDATRTMAFLDVLHGMSEDRQIILFSQEQEVVAWSRAALEESRDRRIELSPAQLRVSGPPGAFESR